MFFNITLKVCFKLNCNKNYFIFLIYYKQIISYIWDIFLEKSVDNNNLSKSLFILI